MENNGIQHPLPIGTKIYSFNGDGEISSWVTHSKNVWLYTVKNEICEFTVYSDSVFLVKSACLAAKEMTGGGVLNHPKTPIGIIPKKHHERLVKTERFNELLGAITRYFEANLKINIEWIEEYNELVDKIDKANG